MMQTHVPVTPGFHPYMDQLAKGHGFTLEELVANRKGELHPAQVARKRNSGMGCGIFLLVFAPVVFVAGLIGAYLYYDDLNAPISRIDMNAVIMIAGGGLVAGLVSFALAAWTFRKVVRRRRAYALGRCGFVDGPVQKIKVRRQGNNSYLYRVGTVGFDFVPRAGWELVVHGARYRVYYLGPDLLSLEPL